MNHPHITVYGIANCDTVKKSRQWLQAQGWAYSFHDFKKDGVPADRISTWIAHLGWERLINRKGTTWRRLDTGSQQAVHDADTATALMKTQSSVIKRPVVEIVHNGHTTLTAGFSPEAWEAALKS